ncbi:hypothetical protein PCC7424_1617 [Gloeothece citriformis PCC 7424]|uniref:Bromodomain-containing protein n=1 Tax=Gloeothece citriformis (strain PCC 7424) TaxID=65393 RepID=B7K9T8_GLOC7|nr:hypothetical protein [Gloeothece citriformis]ACK70056.1 hypothetical protein PCC7424_1617 [Gloeothece citriformis PCC 7424]
MSFKYKWKNGHPPHRDKAVGENNLLDESQFENEQDQSIAEQQARRYLNVPMQTLDHNSSILPQAAPPEQQKKL